MDKRASMLKIERPAATLRELALRKLRDAIAAGYYAPGDRLLERDLCEQLGVSRTIVREVFRHLESEGLVVNLPNKGPIVAQLDLAEAKQIYEIRGALEGMAAKLCAERRDPATIARLEDSLQGIRKSYLNKDLPGVLQHTTTFYQVLFTSVDRHVAWEIVNSLTVRINHLRSMTIRTADRPTTGPLEMEIILKAIREGNGDGAYQAAVDHVVSASSIAEQVLSSRIVKTARS